MKLSATRQAIHDALAWGWLQKESGLTDYLTYLTQIQKTQKPSNAAMDMVEAAYICAAIDSLSPSVSGWIRFAYAPESSDVLLDALASSLRYSLFQISTAKKHAKLFGLAQTALEDYRLRLRRCREMPVSVYCERMGVCQPNYYRDGWGDKQDVCLQRIRSWDKEGIGNVSRVVKALRGDNEDETASQILEELVANDKC